MISYSVMLDSLGPHGLQPTRFCPWDLLAKNIGVDCCFLLQGIFLTQGSNLGLLHCRQTFYHLSHQRLSGHTDHKSYHRNKIFIPVLPFPSLPQCLILFTSPKVPETTGACPIPLPSHSVIASSFLYDPGSSGLK